MSSTPAVFPTSVVQFTTKVNHVDVYEDDHINKLQNEVIAMQTYVGTYPQGNRATLTERLATIISTNGSFNQGTAFPVGTLFDGQPFYRTDLNGLYVYNGAAWDLQGGVLSNLLFSYSGFVGSSPGNVGIVIAGSLNSTGNTSIGYSYRFMNSNGSFENIYQTKFYKLPGVSSINLWARIWQRDPSAGFSAKFQLGIGGIVTATLIGVVNRTLPEWINTTVDITGLTNGTTYDLIGLLMGTGASGGNIAFCSDIVGYGA